jgi:hypothetical protein
MAGISLEKIEAIAPDQASLVAMRKLVNPSGWSGLSCSVSGLIWGECQGSGASPYRVVASESDGGYKCTCSCLSAPHWWIKTIWTITSARRQQAGRMLLTVNYSDIKCSSPGDEAGPSPSRAER